MRTFWLPLLCLVALLAVAVPSWRGGGGFLCRMSARVVASCCCQAAAIAAPKSAAAQAERMSCCRAVQGDERATAASVRENRSDGPAAVLRESESPVVLSRPSSVRDSGLRCTQAAPRGPPLFMAHCSLLL